MCAVFRHLTPLFIGRTADSEENNFPRNFAELQACNGFRSYFFGYYVLLYIFNSTICLESFLAQLTERSMLIIMVIMLVFLIKPFC